MVLIIQEVKMENKKITIIAVNWWGKDFAELLVRSIFEKSKSKEHDIILVDNSGELSIQDFSKSYTIIERIIKPNSNLGHGGGLDVAIKEVKTNYIALFDIDAFVLAQDWDEKIIKEYEKNDRTKMISVKGSNLKPARPLFMFFEKKTIKENDISFKAREFEGVKFDVGIHAYFNILSVYGDDSVILLPRHNSKFKDVLGDEYSLNGERFVYHNWYGTRWYGANGKRCYDIIDNVKWDHFEKCKKSLFNQVGK